MHLACKLHLCLALWSILNKKKNIIFKKSHLVQQLSQQNEIVFKVYFALFLKGFLFFFCGTVVFDIFICFILYANIYLYLNCWIRFVQYKVRWTIYITCSFFLSSVCVVFGYEMLCLMTWWKIISKIEVLVA